MATLDYLNIWGVMRPSLRQQESQELVQHQIQDQQRREMRSWYDTCIENDIHLRSNMSDYGLGYRVLSSSLDSGSDTGQVRLMRSQPDTRNYRWSSGSPWHFVDNPTPETNKRAQKFFEKDSDSKSSEEPMKDQPKPTTCLSPRELAEKWPERFSRLASLLSSCGQ